MILLRNGNGKIVLYFSEMTLRQLKREAFDFSYSAELTIEKHKTYVTALSMFLISLELPKKQHHGTDLLTLYRTSMTKTGYLIL